MMHIRGGAIACDFPQNGRSSALGALQGFEGQDGSTFAERKSIAMLVKRPATRGREGLKHRNQKKRVG